MTRTEAKKYVRSVAVLMLESEVTHANMTRLEGWMFGGLEVEDVPAIKREDVPAIKREVLRLVRALRGVP